MKTELTSISILDDHHGIIDGYLYRLREDRSLKIAGVAHYGDELDSMLAENPTDILILDIGVPVSRSNSTSFLITQVIPRLKRNYPRMKILVISMHTEIVLIEKLVELGINGYISKSDHDSILRLVEIVDELRKGQDYFGEEVKRSLHAMQKIKTKASLLSLRQYEALRMCTAFPDNSTDELAHQLGVSNSTFRNLLSKAYARIGVHTRSAAIAYMQKNGLVN